MEKAMTTTVQQSVGHTKSVRGSAIGNPGLRVNKIKINPNASNPMANTTTPAQTASSAGMGKMGAYFRVGFERK